MSSLILGTFRFLAEELPKILKQNLWRAMLAAVLLTLLIQAAFLNPLFGSTKLKAQLFSVVIGGEAEVEQLIHYITHGEKVAAKNFRIGAALAGYYTSENPGLLEEWEKEADSLTWDGEEAQRNITALRNARVQTQSAA